MENKKKIRLGWLAFSFIVFHFGTILITTFPESYSSKNAQSISNHYVYPLFSQTWSMFAPCPTTEHTLKFKLNFEKDSTDLIIPSTNNFKYHSVFRFTHHGDLVVGEYNILYWVKLDLDRLNIKPNSKIIESKKNEFKNTRGYFLLKQYLTGYSNNSKGKSPISADIELDYYDVISNQLDTYYFKDLK
jgi:hypothetical protein